MTTRSAQIIDFEFEPADLSVAAGTEVTFTNDDTSPTRRPPTTTASTPASSTAAATRPR